LINYYEILGLSTGAGGHEIKNAFRRLAKIYHPDKNPNGKEQFNRILKAYEILSDPVQKSTYDYRLRMSMGNPQVQEPSSSGTKNWRFDERELKRRQYYNDYIKKQTRETENFNEETNDKRAYSDYKYIFFATPLAVLLFLMIMNLATPYKTLRYEPVAVLQTDTLKPLELKTGSEIFSSFFGTSRFDSVKGQRLSLVNKTSNDVIVTISSGDRFLRSGFIKNYTILDLPFIPGTAVNVQYCEGPRSTLTKETVMDSSQVFGSNNHFYRSLSPLLLKQVSELILLPGHKGFREVSRQEFFEKSK